MSDMRPFSGHESWCPKCLHDDIDYEYQSRGTRLGPVGGGEFVLINDFESPEWMLRRCAMCRYAWAESVAEADR